MSLSASSKISDNWVLVTSSSPQVSYINSAPVLNIASHLPDDTFKEDVSISVKVQNNAKS